MTQPFAALFIPWFRLEPLRIPFPVLGELPIQPFGVLVATGVFLGAHIAGKRAEKQGMAPSVIADLVTHVILSGFFFGHALDAIFYYPDRTLENPWFVFQFWNGLSSYGGFTGAIIGAAIWRVRRRVPMIAVCDPIAFSFPFGWLFGRTGCFVVHDHPGRVTDFALAVADYKVGMPPFQPRHDLGFYEILWSLAACTLFLLLGRTPKRNGFYLALLPLIYTPIRFGLDFLRAESTEGGDIRYFGLTPGHYASVALFVVGALLMRRVYQDPPVEIPPQARLENEPGPSIYPRASKRPQKK